MANSRRKRTLLVYLDTLKALKVASDLRGLSMVDLLDQILRAWLREHRDEHAGMIARIGVLPEDEP